MVFQVNILTGSALDTHKYISVKPHYILLHLFLKHLINDFELGGGKSWKRDLLHYTYYTFAFQISIRLFYVFALHAQPPAIHTVTCLHKHTSPKDIYVSVCQQCPSLQLCTWRSFHSYTQVNPDTCSHLHTLLTPQQPSHSTAPNAHYVPVPLCIWEHKYSTTAAVKLKQQVMKAPALSRANDWKVHLHFKGTK